MSFASIGLCPELLQALAAREQFKRPYPIQNQAIPAILQGKDLLAIARTGSGKTAAFILPLLQLIQRQAPDQGQPLKALVLVPTRELAAQIGEVAKEFGRYLQPRVKSSAVFGGVALNPQMIMVNNVELLIATPGRLLELVAKNSVQLGAVAILVLDEAEKMLQEGFEEELQQILSLLPGKRQTLLFSATFAADVQRLATALLTEPLRIEIAAAPVGTELITQLIYTVTPERKGPLLRYLIKNGDGDQYLVFTSSRKRADNVAQKLLLNGVSAATFHAGMSQGGRTAALERFKAGTLQVLVATDLAARGIDISDLPHVVNYELPRSPNDYIHRIGRTGRAETHGDALTLLCPEDLPHFRVIEKRLGQRLAKIDTVDLDLAGY
jgi:ATP-dependent RNA helicase RhlE